MKLSVIVTSEHKSEWVNNTLWALARQTFTDFEVLLVSAEDKTDPQIVESLLQNPIGNLAVRHINLSDQSNQSRPALPVLLDQMENDYIVFLHSNNIPRWDFLASHVKRARAGKCLAGRYYALPHLVSQAITVEDIQWGRCFDFLWLRQNGLSPTANRSRLSTGRLAARMLDGLMPSKYKPGHYHLSGWKSDLNAAIEHNSDSDLTAEDIGNPHHHLARCGLALARLERAAVCLQLND